MQDSIQKSYSMKTNLRQQEQEKKRQLQQSRLELILCQLLIYQYIHILLKVYHISRSRTY